jgi:hypothetical protein
MKVALALSHKPNPDIDGGYWVPPEDAGREVRVSVDSFEAASKAVRAYIERNGLGGSNFTGGVVSKKGEPIAWVSYNGRVWNSPTRPRLCLYTPIEE